MLALCPKCGASVTQVQMSEVEAKSAQGLSLRGVAYSCIRCSAVISVGIDPMALKGDMVREVMEEFKKLQDGKTK